jgi:outer membrane protein OmpA-like peptidoglycan-associated protein
MYTRTNDGTIYGSWGSYVGEPAPAGAPCPGYKRGEIEKSRSQEGILLADTIKLPRGLLIADFAAGSSEIKESTRSEKSLQDWLHAAKSDLYSIFLRIYGYSDCVGLEKNNVELRAKRAQQVNALLGKDLQSRVLFTGPAPPGDYIADNNTREGRARNRGVIIEQSRPPGEVIEITEPKPPPPPPPPRPARRPSCWPHCPPPPPPPPPPPRPPKPPVFRWRPPGVTTSLPPSDPAGPSWVWGPIGLAATALGTVVTIGVRVLSAAELAEILEAAWLVFQLEGGKPLTTVMGMAGEAAAEKLMSRVLGVDPAKVVNLNSLRSNFPVADLISPRGLASVKVRGLLGATVGAARDPTLALEYIQDLVDIAVGGPSVDRKLADAASFLFDNRDLLKARGAWPTGFSPRSVAAVERYVRNETQLFIPNDHVQLVKRTIGEVLNRRVQSGNIRLPPGTNPVAWVTSFVDRVHSIGITSSDLNVLLEATKHIPKEQIPRLARERERLFRLRRRRP